MLHCTTISCLLQLIFHSKNQNRNRMNIFHKTTANTIKQIIGTSVVIEFAGWNTSQEFLAIYFILFLLFILAISFLLFLAISLLLTNVARKHIFMYLLFAVLPDSFATLFLKSVLIWDFILGI